MGNYFAFMVTPTTSTSEITSRSIAAEMERQGLSQVSLAQASGIPRATLQRKLAGFSPSFTIDELERIATALGVDVIALVRGTAA